MSVAIIFVLIPILLLVGLGIPLAIGVYVYRDANRRGMNAVLWTLVAILAPSLIGFIIYLLVRNSSSDMLCPRCDTPVREDYVICPNCGAKLQPYCSNCATPLQPDWKVCPRCTQSITEIYEDVVVPKHHKDNSLWKILVAVLVIPVLLIVVLILSVSVFRVSANSGGSSSVMTEVSLEELYQAQKNSVVEDWMASLEVESGKAYALEYIKETQQNGTEHYYVLYVPDAGAGAEMGFGIGGGFFKDVMRVEFGSGDVSKKSVYCLEVTMEQRAKMEVYCDCQELECEIVEVDFNPTGDLIEPMIEGSISE